MSGTQTRLDSAFSHHFILLYNKIAFIVHLHKNAICVLMPQAEPMSFCLDREWHRRLTVTFLPFCSKKE